MNWARVLAPRLTYRLRHGHWCDHADYYAPAQWSSLDTELVNPGWGPWELYDMGRAKHHWCERCGHYESTYGHPIREWLAATARRYHLALAIISALILVLGACGWVILADTGPYGVIIVFVAGVMALGILVMGGNQ